MAQKKNNKKPYLLSLNLEIEDYTNLKSNEEYYRYNILETTNSRDFFRHIKQSHFDAVLLDVNFCEHIQLIKLIKEIRETYGYKMPLYLISNTLSSKNIIELLSAGGTDFLLKPIIPELLINKLISSMNINNSYQNKNKYMLIESQNSSLKLQLNAEIQSIDEFGFYTKSYHRISIGETISISGKIVNEITGKFEIKTKIKSVQLVINSEFFIYYMEIEDESIDILNNIRNWLELKVLQKEIT